MKVIYKEKNSVNGLLYNPQGQKAGVLKFDGDVAYISFPVLEEMKQFKHGFSTRHGGVSSGYFSSMNLSFTRGDEQECVRENYRRICKALSINPDDLVFSDQVHDVKIHVVTEQDRGYGYRYARKLEGIDGLITDVHNLPLVTFYADCVPIYIVDPVKGVIGLCHSGWRGTVNKIAVHTVSALVSTYQCDPKDLFAVIGPSICRDCYEVSEDVAHEFKMAYTDEIYKRVLEDKGNGKFQLDLWLANIENLLEAGLQREHITNSNICTCCNKDLLYSHRASKGKRGNLAAFLSISDT